MKLVLAILVAGCGSSTSSQPAASPPPAHARPHDKPHAEHHHQHDFHDAATWAQRFDSPDRDAWQKPAEVVQLLEIAPTDTVADLGAGTGYFEPHLARAASRGKVIALDSEPEMVTYLRERMTREGLTNVEARTVAPDDPGLAEATIDRILVVDTWHHLTDRRAYGRKLLAALAPCGALVIVDFTLDSPIGPPPSGRIAPEALRRELEGAGFAARIVPETLPNQYVVVGTKPGSTCSHSP